MYEQLCQIDSIPEGGAQAFEFSGQLGLFGIKKHGQIFLYLNRCPHMYVPLNWEPGRFLNKGGDLIQCSTHGALFAIETGECLQGPCQGKCLQKIEYEVKNDILYIDRENLPE